MTVLREEVRATLAPQGDEGGGGGGGGGRGQAEEDNHSSEKGRMRRRSDDGGGGQGKEIDVRIPAKVYNDGVRAVREALEAVVEVVD